MCINFNVDGFSLVGQAFYNARGKRSPRHRAATLCSAEQRHQRRHVIRTNVKQRTTARLVKEIGIGVKPFVTMADDERAGAGYFTDLPLVNQLPTGLQSPAQKRIGSAAYREPALLRELQKFLAFFERRRDGLLRIDVLTRFERHNIQLGVDGRQR